MTTHTGLRGPDVDRTVDRPADIADGAAAGETVATRDGLIRPGTLRVIAGPCAVENPEQLWATARAVKQAGFGYLRGGAFKPRTSPHDFQGLGVDGLRMLSEVARDLDLGVVTEVVDVADLPAVVEHADVIQIGARNMANFALLKNVGAAVRGTARSVILKRGFAATVDEWLSASEYVLLGGGENVVLCERGIRTFETSTRFTLDLSSVVVARRRSALPVIVDPSHAAGRADLVVPLARLGIAAEADGLIIESHHAPATARCDGGQALPHSVLLRLRSLLDPVAQAFDRRIV